MIIDSGEKEENDGNFNVRFISKSDENSVSVNEKENE